MGHMATTKVWDDIYYQLTTDSTYPCQLITPDTSVFGVILYDRETSIAQLGSDFSPKDDGKDMPREHFCNEDRTQTLTAFFHYGGVRNEVSEFEVRAYQPTDTARVLRSRAFITNSDIRLGLLFADVTAMKGPCYKTEANQDITIIKYHLDDFLNSSFLQRFNMPSYYAEYEFEEDLLVRFRFGFEYP